MKKVMNRYEQEKHTMAQTPHYAGIPVTRPQGMWLVYLDMLGVKWEFKESTNGRADGAFELLLIDLHGKSFSSTCALIVPNDYSLRKHQREISQRMRNESMKALLILGMAPETLQAGVRKVSYIRRGRNGLFHEHAYINGKGEVQNLNNTTFISGFNQIPREATTAYLTHCTDDADLLERHNRAAKMAWEWNFDKDGRCIKVEEPTAPAAANESQDDDITFLEKGGKRPDDPVFMSKRFRGGSCTKEDCTVSMSGERVTIAFTDEAIKKITDSGYVRVSEATEKNPVIYFMEGGKGDFKASPQKKAITRPWRVSVKSPDMASLIADREYKGHYNLQKVVTKSGTKYWCVKLEGRHAE